MRAGKVIAMFEGAVNLGVESGNLVVQEAAAEWKRVHERLQRIARRRGELDAEEARWLRRAEELSIWRRVGCVSPLDYWSASSDTPLAKRASGCAWRGRSAVCR